MNRRPSGPQADALTNELCYFPSKDCMISKNTSFLTKSVTPKYLLNFQVKVAVDDENDNSPVFDRHIYQGTIRRTATTGFIYSLSFWAEIHQGYKTLLTW